MKAPVVVDTNALVWAIRPSDPGSEKAQRAKQFFDDAQDIVVPAIVLTEFLAGCDSAFEEAFEEIQKGIKIAVFDAKAAFKYREIVWPKLKLRMKVPTNSRRHDLMIDGMIIATALAYGATELVTFDQGLMTLACNCGLAAHEPRDPPSLFAMRS